MFIAILIIQRYKGFKISKLVYIQSYYDVLYCLDPSRAKLFLGWSKQVRLPCYILIT